LGNKAQARKQTTIQVLNH